MSEPDFFTSANREVIPLYAGCPVANSPDGNGFVRAQSGVNLAVGLLSQDANPYATGTIQVVGMLSMSDWTVVTGTASLLPDTVYYVSVTPGKLTATAPASPQPVGTSLSPVSIKIEIEPIPSAGGLVGDLDGGSATSVYGGTDPVDGGGA